MSEIARITTVFITALILFGCGKMEGTGTAITSTIVDKDSTKVAMTTIYGYSGSDEKIGFVIFTDIDNLKAASSVSGNWQGEIKLKKGKTIAKFEASPEAIKIDGATYKLSDGRIFLVSYSDGKLTVKQVDLPIEDGDRKEEVTRLSEQKEVQEFLKK